METSEKELQKIHQVALGQFDNIIDTVKDVRDQALEDRRFYSIAGAQWEGVLGEQFENKPKLEVNKIHLAVIRIINEYRQNRITVNFLPKDANKNDKLSDLCSRLYRSDEQDSCAEEAYDNAFEEAVGGGFGAWRLRAEYEDEDDDDNTQQRIRIEPIYDADSTVFFDVGSRRQDKSDAKYCFVLTGLTHEEYEEEYGDDISSWSKDVSDCEYDWVTPDTVYVAEYYKLEKVKHVVFHYESDIGIKRKYTSEELEDDEDGFIQDEIKTLGLKKVGEKRLKKTKVRKMILSGTKVLEDLGYIAGDCIPIIPVYGKRWVVDNIERFMGHVRLSKDMQRLKNMQLSKLAELSAYSSVEKPIFTPEQVAGHSNMWTDDNIQNYPYLLINPVTDIQGNQVAQPPIGYTKSPNMPQTMGALLQLTEQDMNDLLGNQQAGEQLSPNLSGYAVELVQNSVSMQSYIYLSNMAKAIKRSGRIWLGMAKELMVEENRQVKTVNERDEVGFETLNRTVLDAEQGMGVDNDMSTANLEVSVSVGMSFESQRKSIVRTLTEMLQYTQEPENQQVISSMIMMNMEGEGIGDIRKYFRKKLLRMGAVEPTKDESEELQAEVQNAQPSPQDLYLQAATEAENAKVAATMAKAESDQADTLHTLARTEETRAKTLETLGGIDRQEQARAEELAKTIVNAAQQVTTQPVQSGEMRNGVISNE